MRLPLGVFLLIGICAILGAADPPPTVPQSVWAVDGTRPLPERMKAHLKGITSVVLHHTESPNQPPAMEKARLVGVQRFHIEEKGWGDIAYHYLIGPSGTIYEGRDWRLQGDSGTSYDLDGRLLICLVGSFTEQLPEAATMQSMIALVAAKLHEHGLKSADVVTHRMVAATDCPGDALQTWFDTAGRGVIEQAYEGQPWKFTPSANAVERAPMAEAPPLDSGAVFLEIPSLAKAPAGTPEGQIIKNQRVRSPDGAAEFAVIVVRWTGSETVADRRIRWALSEGESITTQELDGAVDAEGNVIERYAVTGSGDSYIRYFKGSSPADHAAPGYSILWELLVRSPEAHEFWKPAYEAFKAKVDLSGLK